MRLFHRVILSRILVGYLLPCSLLGPGLEAWDGAKFIRGSFVLHPFVSQPSASFPSSDATWQIEDISCWQMPWVTSNWGTVVWIWVLTHSSMHLVNSMMVEHGKRVVEFMALYTMLREFKNASFFVGMQSSVMISWVNEVQHHRMQEWLLCVTLMWSSRMW